MKRRDKTMQAEELICEIQKGLLKWYKFNQGSTILYFGDKSDSYASFLKEQAAQFICISAETLEIEGWEKEYTNTADYIVSVDFLEKNPAPGKLLKSCVKLLKTEGIILLGLNNRFGLRYFCGDRDPYTKRNFDGIEDYRRAYVKKEDEFCGRCFSRAEVREMLREAGLIKSHFYSVLPDLKNPSLIYAEDYLPNEDLSNRLFPTYNSPDTVFMEEESLYNGLIKNGMFHEMANAYLVECSVNGRFSDILHVTSSLERGREKALLTVIRRTAGVEKEGGAGAIVEKHAAYPEGEEGLKRLYNHCQELSARGISVVMGKLEKGFYSMPYIECEVGQLYLKRLLHTDREKFLYKMDEFRDLILKSSEAERQDRGDGEGVLLKKGYLDMVPLNSFYKEGTFVFYDQEFCEEHYPANAVIWRMIATFYAGDMEVQKILPIEVLLERYDLKKKLEKWQKMEGEFLARLRQERVLQRYHDKYRQNYNVIHSNRQRMNYSAEEYQKLFVDIFRNAGTRKLVLFGSGVFARRFLELYRQDYPVYAVVDNNEDKWGQKIGDIEIQSPKILQQMQSGEYKVLVCIKNYVSVMKQLDAMGIKEYSIYDSSKDYPRKRKPIVMEEGTKPGAVKRKKYHTGYIAGVFDLFHVGHLNMFRRAKEQCEYLIVGVVSDEGVRRYKHKDVFVPFSERIELIRSCRYVDEAVEIPLNFGGTQDAWRLHHFDCQFSGSDYADNPDWLAEKEFLERHGAEMIFFPYTEQTSSTQIKELIEKKLL